MKCADIFNKLGFECSSVPLASGRTALRITTPICTLDGTPFNVIIQDLEDGRINISDDAETFFALNGEGFKTLDRRKWSSFRNSADSVGIKLSDQGEFYATYESEDLEFVFGDWLQFFSLIVEWQRERSGRADSEIEFADEVEFQLKAIWPNEKISRDYKVTGYSGAEYDYDFKIGARLIDAVSPDSRSTGSRLRKILDTQKLDSEAEIQIIMDDRVNPDRARAEIGIISAIAKVKKYSDLTSQAENMISNQPH